METVQQKKLRLQKELNALQQQQERETQKKYYKKIKEEFEGKFFKRRNRYSRGRSWWFYEAVVEIKPSDVYDTSGQGVTSRFKGYGFETTSDGHINVEKIKNGYTHSLGKEISQAEFDEAHSQMIRQIKKLAQ